MGQVFEAATRGKRYRLVVERTGEDFAMCSFTRGNLDGSATGYTEEAMRLRVAQEIANAAVIDKINYIVVLDELGVVEYLGKHGFKGKGVRK